MPLASEDPLPRVAIVVLNYNGLEDTIKCLASLKAVQYPALSVIVVDNGSEVDPTDAVRLCHPDATMLATGANLGYAGGNNQGMALALKRGADFVLVLNNDTIVSPTIIETLLDAFAAHDRLGVIGPVINHMDEPDTVMTEGVRFNAGPGTEFFQRLSVGLDSVPPAVVSVDIVNGCCMMFRSATLKSVGLFDETFFIVHEESDICLRASRAGFTCAVLGQCLVWHKGSSSFDRSGRRLQRYFDTRNLYFLLRRHTGRVGISRPLLVSLWHYLRYASYRYETEAEAGKTSAAFAVAEGLRDAFTSRTGPYAERRSFGTDLLLVFLRSLHRLSRAKRTMVG